ncbi:MAG: cell division protein FtsW [bacterium]|nr:cell division protein FtsW [bacterium]
MDNSKIRRLPKITRSGTKNRKVAKKYSPPQKTGFILIFIVLALIIFGLIMLYSTTSGTIGASLLIKQVVWIFFGIICATLINFIGYKRIIPYSKYLVYLTAILLIGARFSRPVNGAYRWIKIPGGIGNIQPSELAKIAIIMFLAYYIPRHQRQISASIKGLIYPMFLCFIILGLTLLGKDLGTTILIAAVIWLILFVSGIKLRYLLPPLLILPAIPIILKFCDKVRWARITSFLSPEVYQKTIGYQLWLSLLALGSGSWTGLGFAKSRMKAEYLPESHTDFILSIVGEELGYIALIILITLYVLFLSLSIYISIKAKDKEGMLLGFGISAMIALQAIINIGVISGAFPTKGMPAPFMSYGGSNIVVCLIGAGFIISISNYTGKLTKNKHECSNLKKREKKQD